ncbi:dolichyl-diphosphooligosaccharide--protein glycosyltransferas-like protein subunit 1 [Viridothelium virens]|uniref:Dolichyl-diphosphooligosaccharide--protein glycosyltransferase subunit 1 n=1 Tax=Viridothelium virens TaxID=1048519 RepID=A0A6A6GY65_VIRVR|nr:dolichyl-diphosphooligosaccharide--protein glycosyltransferas-like protein subunit 1 [Viridothelium virens]
MRSSVLSFACFAAIAPLCAAAPNISKPLSSKQILPSNFKPPQVFKNANLVRNVNLEKSYPRETVNVVIENIDSSPQSEYYLPFEPGTIERIGGLEVRDKKNAEAGPFQVETAEYDSYSPTEFYLIHLPTPLASKAQQTLSISYNVLSALSPLPTAIAQTDKQYLQYTFSAHTPSAYSTDNQKTKLKFPSSDVPDYTIIPGTSGSTSEDPQVQGSSFTYGPYEKTPAGSTLPVTVRYEFTKPVLHTAHLQRDIYVSHWGGAMMVEELYNPLMNIGAKLKEQFSRVEWQRAAYYNPPSAALKEMKFPLTPGSSDAYVVDDIGNVSTTHWRSGPREALLELRPRYPIFGDWRYKFQVGWNAELKEYLRNIGGDRFVLKVPFIEGPKMSEGLEYERVEVRVILPEGATNVEFSTSIPTLTNSTTLYRTYMDTVGRTTLTLVAQNVVDGQRESDLYITYEYPWTAGFRKPLTIFTGLVAVFGATWAIGQLDVSIGKKNV